MGIGRHSKILQGSVALFILLMLQSVLRAYLFCSGSLPSREWYSVKQTCAITATQRCAHVYLDQATLHGVCCQPCMHIPSRSSAYHLAPA